MVSNVDAGSTMKMVTSTTSSKVQPAACRIAFRLSNARRTCASRSGSGEPSSRLPTCPETNRKPLERTAGEYRFFSYSAWRPGGKTTSRRAMDHSFVEWDGGNLRKGARRINGRPHPALFVISKQSTTAPGSSDGPFRRDAGVRPRGGGRQLHQGGG